jgi:hypothetical protein
MKNYIYLCNIQNSVSFLVIIKKDQNMIARSLYRMVHHISPFI